MVPVRARYDGSSIWLIFCLSSCDYYVISYNIGPRYNMALDRIFHGIPSYGHEDIYMTHLHCHEIIMKPFSILQSLVVRWFRWSPLNSLHKRLVIELWCILYCLSEQTVCWDMSGIWDAMILMWLHCNASHLKGHIVCQVWPLNRFPLVYGSIIQVERVLE